MCVYTHTHTHCAGSNPGVTTWEYKYLHIHIRHKEYYRKGNGELNTPLGQKTEAVFKKSY